MFWCLVPVNAEPPAAAPDPTALEQQQASFRLQRESVEKQLAATIPRYERRSSGESTRRNVSFAFAPMASAPLEMPSFPDKLVPFAASAELDCPAMSKVTADGLINSAAQREDISADLLRAVIRRESAFHPCAVSEKGALGLMQLMPSTAEQFGVINPFNPQQNIQGGAAFLKQLLKRFGGDVKLALSAYNAGPERVTAAGGIPEIAETQNYVAAITQDLGLAEPEVVLSSPDDSYTTAPARQQAPITNAMTKPDLHHLTLASPGLIFANPATPVHLATTP